MKSLSNVALFSILSWGGELRNPSSSPPLRPPFSRRNASTPSPFSCSLNVNELAREDTMQIFLKERQLKGDFVSKVTDIVWRREDLHFAGSEVSTMDENHQEQQEVIESENEGGFLKLRQTHEWVSGDETAPTNKKFSAKEFRNDSERRKRLNILRYDAIKREMTLLTIGIGTLCSGYCLIAFSVQAATSYAAGVAFSCLYLQLLYYHVDNLSREAVPRIFTQKKPKKIGIRSEDLRDFSEKFVKGSAIALSSPRLMIPAAIYGLWALSNHLSIEFLDFQIVPAMFGMFAYKAAALVQVYRDNEDLRIVFPEMDEI